MSGFNFKDPDIRKYWMRYGVIMALVFEIVAFVLLGVFLGYLADKKMESTPLLLTLGGIFGFVTGIYRFYRGTKRFLE